MSGKVAAASPILDVPSSFNGTHTAAQGLAAVPYALPATLSGAMTANGYKDVLTVTGRGVIHFAAGLVLASAARNIAVKLAVDGVVVSEKTLTGVGNNDGAVVCGWFDSNVMNAYMADVPFNSSFVLSLRNSATETDKMQYFCTYEVK